MEKEVKNFAVIGVGGYIAPRHLKAIYDTGNNQIIFQQIVTGTTVNVPTHIFRPGNAYRLYQLVYDFDYFRLRQGLLPGSKVELG